MAGYIYLDELPVSRQSPIQVVTGPNVEVNALTATLSHNVVGRECRGKATTGHSISDGDIAVSILDPVAAT